MTARTIIDHLVEAKVPGRHASPGDEATVLKTAFKAVWNQIADDVNDGHVDDNQTAIEAVLDSDQLRSHGHDEAASIVDGQIKQRGYAKVLEILAKTIQLV